MSHYIAYHSIEVMGRDYQPTEQFHFFRIEKPLPNNLTLSAEYQGDFSESNLAVFDFHRNVFSLILTWTY